MDPEKPEPSELDKEFHSYYVLFILHDYKRACLDEDLERFYAEKNNPHCTHGRHRKSCNLCHPPAGPVWSTGYPK